MTGKPTETKRCGACAKVRKVFPEAVRKRLELIEESRIKRKQNAKPKPPPNHD